MGMRSHKNKIQVWSIRLKDGRPIIFDEEVQCPFPGQAAPELHFTEKKYAEGVLKELKAQGDDFVKENFGLVELWIKKEEICLQMTAEDVHDKALEEMRKGDIYA